MASISEQANNDGVHADAESLERIRRIRRAGEILLRGRPHQRAATSEERIARIREAGNRLLGIRA